MYWFYIKLSKDWKGKKRLASSKKILKTSSHISPSNSPLLPRHGLELRSTAIVGGDAAAASLGRRRLAAVRGLRAREAVLVKRDGIGSDAEEERLVLVLAVDGLIASRQGIVDALVPELVGGAFDSELASVWDPW